MSILERAIAIAAEAMPCIVISAVPLRGILCPVEELSLSR